MAYCETCGAKALERALFCGNCGAKLSSSIEGTVSNAAATAPRTPAPISPQTTQPDTFDRVTNLVGFGLAWWFIVGPEVLGIAVIVGLLTSSWLWFGAPLLVTWLMMSFRATAKLLIFGFAFSWGVIAGLLVHAAGGELPGAIVVGAVLFIISFSIHWYAFRGHRQK